MPPLSSETHGSLLVLLLFIVEAVSLASRSFFVVVMEHWENEFKLSRTVVSVWRSLQLVTQATFTLIGGQGADRFPRLTVTMGLSVLSAGLIATAFMETSWGLCITYGLLAGCGYGATNYNVAASVLMRVVPERRRGVATGIATAGSPVGQMVLVPAFEALIKGHGWRPGFCIAGIVLAIAVPFAFFVLREDLSVKLEELPSPKPCSSTDCGKEGAETPPVTSAASKMRHLASAPWFWLVFFPFFICGIVAVGVVESHIYVLLTERGVSGSAAAWSFGVLMGANGCGIVLIGWLSDSMSRSVVLSAIFAVRVLSLVLLLFSKANVLLAFVFAVSFGIVDYAVVPPTAGIVAARAGKESVGFGFGLMLAVHSAGAALGSLGAGALYDDSGNYRDTLTSSIVLCAVASLSAAAVNERPIWRSSPAREEEPEIGERVKPNEVGKTSAHEAAISSNHVEDSPKVTGMDTNEIVSL